MVDKNVSAETQEDAVLIEKPQFNTILGTELLKQCLNFLGRAEVRGWQEISAMVSISQNFSSYIEKAERYQEEMQTYNHYQQQQ